MRPTRRGLATVAVAALAVSLAYTSPTRALDVVAVPLVVALAVGGVQVLRTPTPTLERDGTAPGVPGDERTRTLAVDGSGLARVEASLPDGVEGAPVDDLVTLPATVEQPCRLAARGVYEPGPVSVTRRDSLGLFGATHSLATDETVVVYPPTEDLRGHPVLEAVFGTAYTAERQAFDSLREYVPGDPLRNVHWKSSAKHDEYMVMEFEPDHHDTVAIAGTADSDRADEMASAVASLAVMALDAGRDVELAVPEGTVAPGTGEAHRRALLELLARTGVGRVDPDARAGADVVVHAGETETTVAVGESTVTLEELRSARREEVRA